jgi:pyruvate formate lyase activating enzyme
MISLKNLLAEHTAPADAALTAREDGNIVRCLACGHRCRVLPGRDGVCRVRFNQGGELRAPFGYVAGLGVDPLEKKPFFHVLPGRTALSFGMLGCDLHCPFCQNWITSQTLRDADAIAQPTFIDPERIVQLALEHDCPVLTSTYNEPLITAEWALAIFKAGQPHGLVGGVLENVLSTIRRLKQMDFWVEVVTLVVPGLNDSDEELRQIADFTAGVSCDIPWHVTAFHPQYKLTDPPPTPPETLRRAYDLGRQAGLNFVYSGNLPGRLADLENTKCPGCGATLIERQGYSIRGNRLQNGACPQCGRKIPGVWQ